MRDVRGLDLLIGHGHAGDRPWDRRPSAVCLTSITNARTVQRGTESLRRRVGRQPLPGVLERTLPKETDQSTSDFRWRFCVAIVPSGAGRVNVKAQPNGVKVFDVMGVLGSGSLRAGDGTPRAEAAKGGRCCSLHTPSLRGDGPGFRGSIASVVRDPGALMDRRGCKLGLLFSQHATSGTRRVSPDAHARVSAHRARRSCAAPPPRVCSRETGQAVPRIELTPLTRAPRRCS